MHFLILIRKKLLDSLQESLTGLSDVHARYWHFVKTNEELSDEELAQLKELLHYGESDTDGRPYGELLLVTPRPGTISPWSSKATDIIHNCGLDKVERVERGIAYFIEYRDDFTSASYRSTFFHNRENSRPYDRRSFWITKTMQKSYLVKLNLPHLNA